MANLDKSLGRALEQLDETEDYDALWHVFVAFLKGLGADLISYHHNPPQFGPDKDKVTVRAEGFSPKWVEIYARDKLYLIDPITQLAAQRLNPFRWSDIGTLVTLTAEQKHYIKILKEWMMGDGLAVPAFGPSGRNGYFGIGHSESIDTWDDDKARIIYWVCQAFHHRVCELRLRDMKLDFVLSPRETKILRAMHQGISDPMICGLINARLDSVQSSIQRMMRKMGVSDRASLILRGVACGVIEG